MFGNSRKQSRSVGMVCPIFEFSEIREWDNLKVPDFGEEITKTGYALNGKTELVGNCGGTFSNPTYLITPKVGDFYIFPYDMQHLVYPFKGDGMRRSLVMNFDFKRVKKYSMKDGKRVEDTK